VGIHNLVGAGPVRVGAARGARAVLVDLACGRGGPGLWLCRATGADLVGVDWSPVGVDWSPVAVREATGRATDFVPSDRVRFLVGDLAASGLPDECADAVVCLDAVFSLRIGSPPSAR
jgi:ubiquinone/menaquinone biosynthesis C-methylase UbiE